MAYILTSREDYINLVTESGNFGFLDTFANAIKQDIKSDYDKFTANNNPDANAIELKAMLSPMVDTVKLYLNTIYDKLGYTIFKVSDDGKLSGSLNHSLKSITNGSFTVLESSVRSRIDNLMTLFKSVIDGTLESDNGDRSSEMVDLTFKRKVMTIFKEVYEFNSTVTLAKPFDGFLNEVGLNYLKNNTAVNKLRDGYNANIQFLTNELASTLETHFYEYFRLELPKNVPEDLLKVDPEDGFSFLIKTRQELGTFYKESIRVDFNESLVFKTSFNSSAAILKNFMLEYSNYPTINQRNHFALSFVDNILEFKNLFSKGITVHKSEYSLADYRNLADNIISQFLESGANFGRPINLSNLSNDVKKYIFSNSFYILEGALDSNIYDIDDWDTDLKNLFKVVLVDFEDYFNEYMREELGLVYKVSSLGGKDFFNEVRAQAKKTFFRKFFKQFKEYLSENPLSVTDPKIILNPLAPGSKAKVASSNKSDDEYSYEYYLSKRRAGENEIKVFSRIAAGKGTDEFSNIMLLTVLNNLAPFEILSNDPDKSMVRKILSIRDEYLKNIEPSKNPNQISLTIKQKVVENSVELLYYYYNYLGDSDKISPSVIVNRYAQSIFKNKTLKDILDLKLADSYFKSLVISKNITIVDSIGKRFISDDTIRSKYIKEFDKLYGLSGTIDKTVVTSYFNDIRISNNDALFKKSEILKVAKSFNLSLSELKLFAKSSNLYVDSLVTKDSGDINVLGFLANDLVTKAFVKDILVNKILDYDKDYYYELTNKIVISLYKAIKAPIESNESNKAKTVSAISFNFINIFGILRGLGIKPTVASLTTMFKKIRDSSDVSVNQESIKNPIMFNKLREFVLKNK